LGRARLRILLLTSLAMLCLGADPGDGVQRNLAYVDPPDPESGEAQTLDLYLPETKEPGPPLLVFVHSRFWSEAPGGKVIADGFARPLQRRGVAVALVRHRPAPPSPHTAPPADVASAVAFLVRNADRFGYDPKRITLSGHSSGAHLASLVALDPRYLKEVGLESSALAGVVAISGIYDLDPGPRISDEERARYEQTFGDAAARREASPLQHARPDAPRFLLLSAEQDVGGYVMSADRFAASLRDAGHPDAESNLVMGRTHANILHLDHEGSAASVYLLDFLGVQPLPPELTELRAAARYWRRPRFTTEPLWTSGAPVRNHPVSDQFVVGARRIFQGHPYQSIFFRPRSFDAIGLPELLDTLGPERVGKGDWLTLTNALNEKTVLSLPEIRPYGPVIVIGIDGERNPFRTVDIDKFSQQYSWRTDVPSPPYVARPMGAFLHFLGRPPPYLLAPLPTTFGLDISSFQLSEADPLGPLRDLDPEVLDTVTIGRGCVSCHSFRGVGSRAGHLRATNGEPQGGFALPLEEYPPRVWRRFVLDPSVNDTLSAGHPGPGRGPIALKLLEAVERERGKR